MAAFSTRPAFSVMQLFVDNLTNSDFCYLDPVRGLVGETWLSHIALEGELDAQGMICDFGVVKGALRRLLDDAIDHRLLVPSRAGNLEVSTAGDETILRWQLLNDLHIRHRSPSRCITLIDSDEINRESVAYWCEQQLWQQLPETVQTINISFSEETIAGAYYHYSHGLKKHDGKCQRIAHGHRSKIEIWRDGSRDHGLEADWAEYFKDIYIGTRGDEVSAANEDHCRFLYQATEGEFELELPATQCYLIAADSTVENIARHIATTIKSEYSNNSIRVKAYEGLCKGAVCGA